MFHHKILEKFKQIYPLWSSDVYEWEHYGKNTIKIKLTSRKETLIFEYYDARRWCLRTERFV
jgi:hypothetical protein